MAVFRIGQEYTKRGITVKVISRTAQRLTVDHDGNQKLVRVREHNNREYIVVKVGGVAFEIQAQT